MRYQRGEVRATFKHMLEVQLHAVASTIATKLPNESWEIVLLLYMIARE